MIRSHICPQFGPDFEPAQLVVQVILQRLRAGNHVGHRVVRPLAFFFQPGARRLGPLLEVVGPLLVHVEQALEIFLVVLVLVDDQLTLFFRRCVGIHRLGRLLRQIEVLFLQLEGGILLHLLFDAFLQRHDRQLQNLHRLDHAGCQHLLLHHPQFLSERKSHARSLQ